MNSGVGGLVKRAIQHFKNFENPILNELTITVYSQRQLNVIGYDKILKFDDYVLVISYKEKILKVEGSNLVLSEMAENSLIINGLVKSIEFLK